MVVGNILKELAALYIKGLQSSLPFVLECSHAYQSSISVSPHLALSKAEEAWEPYDTYGAPPPCADPWALLCWGNNPPFEATTIKQFAECAKTVFGPINEAKD